MPDSPAIPARVLFVDDDMSFLQMVRDVFGNISSGIWEIQTATSGGDALQRLRGKPFDLAIMDVFMPGMDGLQLLRLLNIEFPSMPKVLLTGMPDANTREQALEGGAALFLEKPGNADGYDSVYATLNELVRWHKRFSQRGALRRLSLLDLVKLECKSGNSRLFEVFTGEVRGEIYIEKGVIIHAIMPDRRGQSAFTYLTTSPGAVFYLRQFVEPIERSVDRQWEFLVMESAHVMAQLAETPPALPEEPPPAQPAESAQANKDAPATALHPKRQPTPTFKMAAPAPPPLASADAPVAPLMAPAPLPAQAVQPRVLKAGSPPPTTLEFQGHDDLVLDTAPDALPLESATDPAGFKVEETVLFQEFREVLYSAHCPDASKRMRLAEALMQRLSLFAAQLPLGDLERVEMNSTGSRMVIRFDARRCLLVRTNTKVTQPAGDPAATESAEEWLARLGQSRGLLAATVVTSDGREFCRSFGNDFPLELVQKLAQDAARLPELALKNAFPAWFVRGLFSHAQLYAFRRQDGAVLVACLSRLGVDSAAIAEFGRQFTLVRAV